MSQEHEPYRSEKFGQPTLRRRRLENGELLKGLFTSQRFYATAAAILVKLFGKRFGLDEQMADVIVQTIASWVVGDSIRPSENIFQSRRFWVMVGTILASVLASAGIGIDPAAIQNAVLAIAAWIIGDAWRETLYGIDKVKQRQVHLGP